MQIVSRDVKAYFLGKNIKKKKKKKKTPDAEFFTYHVKTVNIIHDNYTCI